MGFHGILRGFLVFFLKKGKGDELKRGGLFVQVKVYEQVIFVELLILFGL